MDAEGLAELERSRLRTLVAADLVAANALHAADLIAVDGRELGAVRCRHTDDYEHRDGRRRVVFL